jgi:hypothetical protein
MRVTSVWSICSTFSTSGVFFNCKTMRFDSHSPYSVSAIYAYAYHSVRGVMYLRYMVLQEWGVRGCFFMLPRQQFVLLLEVNRFIQWRQHDEVDYDNQESGAGHHRGLFHVSMIPIFCWPIINYVMKISTFKKNGLITYSFHVMHCLTTTSLRSLILNWQTLERRLDSECIIDDVNGVGHFSPDSFWVSPWEKKGSEIKDHQRKFCALTMILWL